MAPHALVPDGLVGAGDVGALGVPPPQLNPANATATTHAIVDARVQRFFAGEAGLLGACLQFISTLLVSRNHGSRHLLRGPGICGPLGESSDAREDLVGGFRPDEWFRIVFI